ncbi:MAG: hypothetical protein DRP70_08425 [Spirochaetes bacterium]|nr:MAG: hypothetical protein DRP60_00800 [Spirochaetota bacterium]RKX87461.1 MAG: hypothetical protein DRP70_08425 [Spirochaetota bacterium]
MNAFKSPEGRDEIGKACRKLYSECPIPAESRFLDTVEFGKTHVLTAGKPESPPLLLLHGTSVNAASWFSYFPDLAKDFHIFALDIPGQPGLSGESRPRLADGSMSRWLETVKAELGLEKFHLCGMSMGSWISLDYGLKHPDSILGMCVLAPGGLAQFRISFFLKSFLPSLQGNSGILKMNRLVHGKVPVLPEFDSFAILISRHFRPLAERIPIFPDKAVKGINFPLLYIGGIEDPLLNTRKSAGRLRRLLPDAQIRELDGIAHVILDESPAIRAFLTGIPGNSTQSSTNSQSTSTSAVGPATE